MADFQIPGGHVYESMVFERNAKEENIKKVKDLEVVDGDILIASYPKTGTTWIQEITWLVCNDANIEAAKSSHIIERSRYLEYSEQDMPSGIDYLQMAKRPAVMKTHLPASLVQKLIENQKLKVIITIRNPKDTLVSLYHFYRMNAGLGNFPGTWDDFFELYRAKRIMYGDYFKWYNSWVPHMHSKNVQFFRYEDMKTDLKATVERLCHFLGKDLDDEQVMRIVKHTSFDRMRDNKMVNLENVNGLNTDISPFMRKGQVGDWKNHFSEEQSREIDERYEGEMKKRGLEVRFE